MPQKPAVPPRLTGCPLACFLPGFLRCVAYNDWFSWKACMHELSVAQNIVDIVGQYVPADHARDVRLVRIRIGPLAGIVAESLEFCFGAIVSGTPLEKARLDIVETSVESKCGACGRVFTVDGSMFLCPGCGSADVTIMSGTELQVVEIEVSERQAETA